MLHLAGQLGPFAGQVFQTVWFELFATTNVTVGGAAMEFDAGSDLGQPVETVIVNVCVSLQSSRVRVSSNVSVVTELSGMLLIWRLIGRETVGPVQLQ